MFTVQKRKKPILDEFNLWLKTKFIKSFKIEGHRFEKAGANEINVDNGQFTKEEAKQLFMMMTSSNPFTRLTATVTIWERNGTLIKLLLVTAFLLLAFVFTRIRK